MLKGHLQVASWSKPKQRQTKIYYGYSISPTSNEVYLERQTPCIKLLKGLADYRGPIKYVFKIQTKQRNTKIDYEYFLSPISDEDASYLTASNQV